MLREDDHAPAPPTEDSERSRIIAAPFEWARGAALARAEFSLQAPAEIERAQDHDAPSGGAHRIRLASCNRDEDRNASDHREAGGRPARENVDELQLRSAGKAGFAARFPAGRFLGERLQVMDRRAGFRLQIRRKHGHSMLAPLCSPNCARPPLTLR